MPPANRQVILKRRPVGEPKETDFELRESPVPAPADGQALCRTVWLSLDPYMRGRMSEGPSYAAPVPLGGVMCGGTVSRVEESKNPALSPGDFVLGYDGWQEWAVADAAGLRKLDPEAAPLSYALGVLGMPGMTAYVALLDVGRPKEGETVVVSAAAGAVGSVAGQIAKLRGCRAVGVAGSDAKCEYVTKELGFDACLDHREAELGARLAQACPRGIDVYFESVGGAVFEAVLPLLNPRARVPVCGLIALYDLEAGAAAGGASAAQLERVLLTRRIRMQGFIIFDDYGPRFGEFREAMGGWLREGRIKYREDIAEGLENAPAAFIAMLEGGNFGKQIVQVA